MDKKNKSIESNLSSSSCAVHESSEEDDRSKNSSTSPSSRIKQLKENLL